eukprot:8786924-Ditylum_brightwellii.AAC.1
MDKGQFNHVKCAILTVCSLHLGKLCQSEKLLSLPPPPNTTIVPALEQNEIYFCGGHTASEWLSTVHIGEL